MLGHPKHVHYGQEAYPQHNTPLPGGNDATVGGPSSKSDAGDFLAPSSADDDEAQMNSDLVAAWTQRLQVLTAVIAFLASMDASLFSLTALNTQIGRPVGATSRELIYSCLAGALVLHICACILSYIASFALVRYRIIDIPGEDETKVGDFQSFGLGTAQLLQRPPPRKVVWEPVRPLRRVTTFVRQSDRLRFLSSSRSPPSPPPSPLSLLTQCYYTTLGLTSVGFILAVTGILSYTWAGLPAPVGIASTVCLGVAVSACVWALAA